MSLRNYSISFGTAHIKLIFQILRSSNIKTAPVAVMKGKCLSFDSTVSGRSARCKHDGGMSVFEIFFAERSCLKMFRFVEWEIRKIFRQKEAKSPASASHWPLSRDLAVCPCQRTESAIHPRLGRKLIEIIFLRSISEIDGERRKSRFAPKTQGE